MRLTPQHIETIKGTAAQPDAGRAFMNDADNKGVGGVELIVTTYNNPTALHYTLLGLQGQTFQDFRICIADDGSGDETLQLIQTWQRRLGADRLRHVWQPDNGFAKNQILNKAIITSHAEYLIFVDGDCIAAPNFIERHISLRREKYFVSGGVLRMPRTVNGCLTDELISTHEIFSYKWLKRNNCLARVSYYLKAALFPEVINGFLEVISPVKKTWNGGNSSAWKSDLISVNGFDETLRYGAEDVELGVRLNNFGVKSRHVRYSSLVLHIEHDRGYLDRDVFDENKKYVKSVRNSKKIRTNFGINKD